MTYFLPTRLVRVTATRMPVDLAKMVEDRDKNVAALPAATAAVTITRTRREAAQAAVDEPVAVGVTVTAEQRAAKAKALEDARKAEADATKKEADLKAEIASAGQRIVTIQMTGATCQYSAKLELLPVQADRSARFYLEPRHSGLRDDTNTFVVSPAGLLTSAHVVADDQTGQVIIGIAETLGLISGWNANPAAAAIPGSRGGERGVASPCWGPPSVVQIFDPFDDTEVQTVNSVLGDAFQFRVNVRAEGAWGPAGERASAENASDYLPQGTGSGLYYRAAAPIILELQQKVPPPRHCLSAGQTQPPGVDPLPPCSRMAPGPEAAPDTRGAARSSGAQPEEEGPGWNESALDHDSGGGAPPPAESDSGQNGDRLANLPAGGAPAEDANANANADHQSNVWQTVDSAVLLLPQAGAVSFIPMRASPFVRTTDDVQFVDGSLVSWTSERPSELAAVARLPGQVLEAFVTAFAKAITLRINVSTSRQTLGVRQAEEIVQAERNRVLLECINVARRDDTDVLACLPETE